MLRLSSLLSLVFFVTSFLPARPARAQTSASSLESAKEHFDAGQHAYDVGDFATCAKEFAAAYQAKPFAASVFNGAVCNEKNKDYQKALDLFQQYLKDQPKAPDRKDVEQRIAALTKELQKEKAGTPAQAMKLPEMKTKGIVYIESQPPGASIFLDTRAGKPIGSTPWSGSLEGEHTVILVMRGYKLATSEISPRADKFYHLKVELSEDSELGWLEVSANIPGAAVYLDRKDQGAVGRTPFRDNVVKGKHRIFVDKKGYREVVRNIDVKAGEAQKLDVNLQVAPVGYVHVRGVGVVGARVTVDDKLACAPAPCQFQAPEGRHRVEVKRDGKKDYGTELTIQPRTETTLKVNLADTPSRSDAVGPFLVGVVLGAGGAALVLKSNDLSSKVGLDPKIWKIGGYVIMGMGALSVVRGFYYLVRDKGPPSTGQAEVRDLAVTPVFGPGYAGVSAGGTF